MGSPPHSEGATSERRIRTEALRLKQSFPLLKTEGRYGIEREKAKRINSSREVALGNAVVARARRWRPQVNGRKNNNKSKLLGRAEFTRRPGA